MSERKLLDTDRQSIQCIDCPATFTGIPFEDGLRCPRCARKEHLEWLNKLLGSIRVGVPDGHTPAMSPDQKVELEVEIKKLREETSLNG